MVCLLIALRQQLLLCAEAFTLVYRVVKLGVSISHFPAVHEELKPLHIVRVIRLAFGEGGYFNRMIGDKCRLDHVLLGKFLKEEIENITLLMARLKCNSLFFGNSLCLVVAVYLVEVDARILFHRVKHTYSLKRLAEIHLDPVVGYHGSSQNLFCHITVQILGKLHDSMIIGIRLIQLHKGKLRVVPGINSLIAEYPAYLIHLFKTAHNKPLEVKLKRYAELEVLVKSVEMRLEGASRRSARV